MARLLGLLAAAIAELVIASTAITIEAMHLMASQSIHKPAFRVCFRVGFRNVNIFHQIKAIFCGQELGFLLNENFPTIVFSPKKKIISEKGLEG